LYSLFGELKIVEWIRSARLRWAGHIVRIRVGDQTRKSTLELLLGERTVGRPKTDGLTSGERTEANGC
jgi:hypothetical protein